MAAAKSYKEGEVFGRLKTVIPDDKVKITSNPLHANLQAIWENGVKMYRAVKDIKRREKFILYETKESLNNRSTNEVKDFTLVISKENRKDKKPTNIQESSDEEEVERKKPATKRKRKKVMRKVTKKVVKKSKKCSSTKIDSSASSDDMQGILTPPDDSDSSCSRSSSSASGRMDEDSDDTTSVTMKRSSRGKPKYAMSDSSDEDDDENHASKPISKHRLTPRKPKKDDDMSVKSSDLNSVSSTEYTASVESDRQPTRVSRRIAEAVKRKIEDEDEDRIARRKRRKILKFGSGKDCGQQEVIKKKNTTHERTAAEVSRVRNHRCRACNKFFAFEQSLDQHIKEKHCKKKQGNKMVEDSEKKGSAQKKRRSTNDWISDFNLRKCFVKLERLKPKKIEK